MRNIGVAVLGEAFEALLLVLLCTLLLFVIAFFGTTDEQKEELGLNEYPGVLSAYTDWCGAILHGEWAWSSGNSEDFYTTELKPATAFTLVIVSVALVVSLLIALCCSLWIVHHSKAVSSFILEKLLYFSGAVPVFIIAIMFYELLKHDANTFIVDSKRTFIGNVPAFIVAGCVLGIGSGVAGELTKVFRHELGRILSEPYILASRARKAKVWQHVLRASVIPLSSTLLAKLPFFIGAGIIVERVFGMKGLGYMIIQNALKSHFAEMMAITLIIVVLVALTRVVNKIIVVTFDPRQEG